MSTQFDIRYIFYYCGYRDFSLDYSIKTPFTKDIVENSLNKNTNTAGDYPTVSKL